MNLLDATAEAPIGQNWHTLPALRPITTTVQLPAMSEADHKRAKDREFLTTHDLLARGYQAHREFKIALRSLWFEMHREWVEAGNPPFDELGGFGGFRIAS